MENLQDYNKNKQQNILKFVNSCQCITQPNSLEYKLNTNCTYDEHSCICDQLQKLANSSQQIKMMIFDINMKCRSKQHECICKSNQNRCQSESHECICMSLVINKTKKLIGEQNVQKCKASYHECVCESNMVYIPTDRKNNITSSLNQLNSMMNILQRLEQGVQRPQQRLQNLLQISPILQQLVQDSNDSEPEEPQNDIQPIQQPIQQKEFFDNECIADYHLCICRTNIQQCKCATNEHYCTCETQKRAYLMDKYINKKPDEVVIQCRFHDKAYTDTGLINAVIQSLNAKKIPDSQCYICYEDSDVTYYLCSNQHNSGCCSKCFIQSILTNNQSQINNMNKYQCPLCKQLNTI